jgi:hypothetical protein
VTSIRGTSFLIGHHLLTTGALAYFIKPNPGSRAIDCLGLNGPKPTFVKFLNDFKIMFSWLNDQSETSIHIYSFNGKYSQPVPNLIGPNNLSLVDF